LQRAGNAFLDVLDEYSLADLAKPRTPLRNLLLIDDSGFGRRSPARRAPA
jgi:hypothetical protein